MGGLPRPDRRNLWTALSSTIIAARAHGLGVIDGTYNAIGDDAGLEAACEQGRAFGFDGKTLIHPGQIDICNRVFAPSPEAVSEARRILAAFAGQPDKGVIQLDGKMVERLHADSAAKIVAMADAIAAHSA